MMFEITWEAFSAFLQVLAVDLVLAGDNAIVVGLVAASLPAHQRTKVIIIGIAVATVMRIGFALVTVQLLQIIGLVLAGGLLLLWVCWKLWRELREAAGANEDDDSNKEPKSFGRAVFQIVLADVSMSLDNVLAVAGVARDHPNVLIFGLALSVALMAFGATLIARLLEKHKWIAYVGLVIILYVSLLMIWEGTHEVAEALVLLQD
ncbi:MAG: YjbE family integral membrane protein [Gammaproteobacteria bacterium]|jgi:YjbE family integral membrane protein